MARTPRNNRKRGKFSRATPKSSRKSTSGKKKEKTREQLVREVNRLKKKMTHLETSEAIEKSLRRRLEFEKAVYDISSRFMILSDIDQEIQHSLADMGRLSGADRTYLFLFNKDGNLMRNTHEWCTVGVNPQIENLQDLRSDTFPWWMKKLENDEVIHIEDVSQLPREANAEKEILESQGIQSVLVIPVSIGDRLAGFIGFDNVKSTGTWNAYDLALLQLVSNVFGRALGRKAAEDELRIKDHAIASSISAIGLADLDGRLLYANPSFLTLWGYSSEEKVRGKMIDGFWSDKEKASEVGRKLHGQGWWLGEMTALREDGSTFEAQLTAHMVKGDQEKPLCLMASAVDVTNRKKMEKELIKSAKLESLGVLAAGIAHDFNNLLAAILGNISVAKIDTRDNQKLAPVLGDMEEAAQRAKELVKKLVTFAKGGRPVKEVVSLSGLVKDSVKFALSGSNVKCEFSIEEDLPLAEVDRGQIDQVLNNIVINAVQAMPGGGEISVSVRDIEPATEQSVPLPDLRFVKISVEDHGTGIPKEHLTKVFDPFFSVKETGSGLGLSTAYSIVKNHEGFIHIESEEGSGTVVAIYLPVTEKALSDPGEETMMRGRVLVMDDEEIVRNAAGRLLDRIGFEVESAPEGQTAIAMYREALSSDFPYVAVILDLTIPGGMGGREAIQELSEIDPEVKAIVASGYSDDPIMAEYRKYGFSGRVAKPFTIDELGRELGRVLRE